MKQVIFVIVFLIFANSILLCCASMKNLSRGSLKQVAIAEAGAIGIEEGCKQSNLASCDKLAESFKEFIFQNRDESARKASEVITANGGEKAELLITALNYATKLAGPQAREINEYIAMVDSAIKERRPSAIGGFGGGMAKNLQNIAMAEAGGLTLNKVCEGANFHHCQYLAEGYKAFIYNNRQLSAENIGYFYYYNQGVNTDLLLSSLRTAAQFAGPHGKEINDFLYLVQQTISSYSPSEGQVISEYAPDIIGYKGDLTIKRSCEAASLNSCDQLSAAYNSFITNKSDLDLLISHVAAQNLEVSDDTFSGVFSFSSQVNPSSSQAIADFSTYFFQAKRNIMIVAQAPQGQLSCPACVCPVCPTPESCDSQRRVFAEASGYKTMLYYPWIITSSLTAVSIAVGAIAQKKHNNEKKKMIYAFNEIQSAQNLAELKEYTVIYKSRYNDASRAANTNAMLSVIFFSTASALLTTTIALLIWDVGRTSQLNEQYARQSTTSFPVHFTLLEKGGGLSYSVDF